MAKKRKGRSAAFMRSINPNLRKKARTVQTRSRSFKVAKRKTVTSKGINFLNRPTIKGALYGIVRTPINNATKQLLGNIPALSALGAVGDEVILWLLGTAGSTMTKKNPGVKNLFKTMQVVEAHNIGRQINLGGIGGILGNTQTAPAPTNPNTNTTTKATTFPDIDQV